ncbi:MAG: hypothetical protein L6Q74_05155 [Sphaerotilus natans subsp. sulfidivorans]|uniref:hypothetical protein n=1 Tax=Sphaerotilus sulfidivorans TaxID=639200 RepID=UPI0023556194|nr:hypothetical protein [Sphaerotilus sulfidivorans]MCK6401287.1 hypothetical protein [Sphaerotilus sulfidivorans]
MKTAEQMTRELQIVFDELKAGKIAHKEAAELTNCVGKMIGLAKVQLEYHAQRKEQPDMPFFGSNSLERAARR